MSVYKVDKTFTSLGDYATYLGTTPKAQGAGDASTENHHGHRWTLGVSFDATKDILGKGGYWPEGAEKLTEAFFAQEESKNVGLSDATINDVSGYLPIIPEYLAGSPTCMINDNDLGFGKAVKPVVKIGVNIGALANISGETMQSKGAAVLSLITDIEASGKRTELWAISDTNCYTDGGNIRASVCIKKPEELWAPSFLAFPLMHPAFFRRSFFRFVETLPSCVDSTNAGYGTSVHLEESDVEDYDVYFGALAYWGEGVNIDNARHYTTPEEALEYVRKLSEGLV